MITHITEKEHMENRKKAYATYVHRNQKYRKFICGHITGDHRYKKLTYVELIDKDGNVFIEEFDHDSNGNMTHYKCSDGFEKFMTYRKFDLISKTTNEPKITLYHYDGKHGMLSHAEELISGDRYFYTFNYDYTNDPILIERERDGVREIIEQREFNGAGNLIYQLQNGGVTKWNYEFRPKQIVEKCVNDIEVTEYICDDKGRIISEAYTNLETGEKHTQTFIYERNERIDRSYSDTEGYMAYKYNEIGNLTEVIFEDQDDVFYYEYENFDTLVKMYDKKGSVVHVTYDDDFNIISMKSEGDVEDLESLYLMIHRVEDADLHLELERGI